MSGEAGGGFLRGNIELIEFRNHHLVSTSYLITHWLEKKNEYSMFEFTLKQINKYISWRQRCERENFLADIQMF